MPLKWTCLTNPSRVFPGRVAPSYEVRRVDELRPQIGRCVRLSSLSPSFSTAHIAAFRPRQAPKEAGRTSGGGNGEEECAALAATAPTRGARWPQEGRFSVGNFPEGDRAARLTNECDETLCPGAFLRNPALLACWPRFRRVRRGSPSPVTACA